jgi:hypothetical protein
VSIPSLASEMKLTRVDSTNIETFKEDTSGSSCQSITENTADPLKGKRELESSEQVPSKKIKCK